MPWRFLILLIVIPVYIPFLYKRFKKGRWMSVLLSILSVALAVYVGLIVLLYIFQSRMIFYPYRPHDYRPEEVGLPYQSVQLTASDGLHLDAWYIPAEEAEFTVLFCHGNAGNISHRLDTLLLFHDLGLNCLIFDYRGYGRSEGRPSEQGVYRDAHAAWDWLTEQQQIPPGRILVFGRSLGGSVAARLAADLAEQNSPPPAALVLESAFTSVTDMGKHYYPWFPIRWFARFQFDTVDAVKRVQSPILVIHSPEDEIVPFKFGQKLYESASQPKVFAQISGTHNEGFLEDFQTYKMLWRKWIQSLKKPDNQDF
jgi:fermentation-respiration switch protein FrsA (DUF1100 family)